LNVEMNLSYREFSGRAELEAAALALLKEAFCAPAPVPRALMLTGGSTPFGVYAALAAAGVRAANGVRVFLSDDRHVPIGSAESNYGRLCPMLDALGVQARLFIDPSVPVAIAAERYDRALDGLLGDGTAFPLGILGLGADGHVASLFSSEHLKDADGHRAIAVRRPDGMNGISTTPSVLCAAERLVFWVAGPEKRMAVEALRHKPSSIPAGLALAAAPSVELWYTPS
jgi:6-phosphogluconolactonase